MQSQYLKQHWEYPIVASEAFQGSALKISMTYLGGVDMVSLPETLYGAFMDAILLGIFATTLPQVHPTATSIYTDTLTLGCGGVTQGTMANILAKWTMFHKHR